jgi:hypothetical protein
VRNEKNDMKSVKIVISKRAYDVLIKEKEKTGFNYGNIVEKALLNVKRHTPLMDNVKSYVSNNVSSNVIIPTVTVTNKKLIDEDDYHDGVHYSRADYREIIFDGKETLNHSFLTRLLKSARRKLFKLLSYV